jgi:predicted dehydrogenase
MMNIGLVGCGNISGIYLKNLTTVFGNVKLYACADLDTEKVKAAAEKYQIPHIMTFDEMLQCEEIGLILNLTTPGSHYALSKKALLAGKHVYVEKPLALTYKDGKELLSIANEKGLYIGCAPDTFLGAGIQTCIRLINAGAIGRPVAGAAFMMCRGHEGWHPSPEFYYDIGGGPLFDMGPYYITALVRLLGRAESVMAYGARAFEERTITSEPKKGTKIPVKVDTHNAGVIRFENGAVVTLVTSFDVWKHSMPKIEIYGTEGSLKVPDPNTFGGPVMISTMENKDYTEVPLETPYSENSRGLGLSETVLAAGEGRINNASGALGLHVLEIMEAFVRSGTEGKMIVLESATSDAVALDWAVEKGALKTK